MNGILLVDKPQNWTSHDVVAKLRGVLHERRIGHSGTLDPLATGLLVVFVGRATRAVQFAEADSKTYMATMRLGVSTDTQDISGSVIAESAHRPTDEEIEAVARRFTGDIKQVPPMYSAIKIGGKKLYEIARRGETVEREPRDVRINSIDIISRHGDEIELKIDCSKGTYIRTLCSDMGDALGCGACMSALRRIRAGAFDISNAHTMEQLADIDTAEKFLLPVDTLFAAYPAFRVNAASATRLKNGNELNLNTADGKYRIYSPSGEFLLLGDVKSGRLKTVKSFFEV